MAIILPKWQDHRRCMILLALLVRDGSSLEYQELGTNTKDINPSVGLHVYFRNDLLSRGVERAPSSRSTWISVKQAPVTVQDSQHVR